MSKLFILILALFTCFIYYKKNHYTLGPGALAPEQPQQSKIWFGDEFAFKGYAITPLASFDIKAMLLSKRQYIDDPTSTLAPIDYALGWGPMSDPTIVSQIEISQGHRWYKWYTPSLPIPAAAISKNSANMHLIPATEEIRAALTEIQTGSIVQLSGSLVLVEQGESWNWKSSTSRTDTGGKACEVFWVDDVYVDE